MRAPVAVAVPPRARAFARRQGTDADILTRIAALEAKLHALKQQHRDEVDAQLLRAIALAAQGAVFSVSDLLERARLDAELRQALDGLRPKALGKRLARCVGRTITGLSVRRVIPTAAGWLWEIHINHDAGAGD
jgi:hypothetical protein